MMFLDSGLLFGATLYSNDLPIDYRETTRIKDINALCWWTS